MSDASLIARIRTLIDRAHGDRREIVLAILARCGLGREAALEALAHPGTDPVGVILQYAGEEHGFALLAVEEALAAA
ncbi:MAG: hypothetical protein ACM33T_07720 [Solirubrobacterales bacterium]